MPKNKILTYAGLGSASLLASLPVFLTLGPVFCLPNASAEEVVKSAYSGGGAMTVSIGSALAITADDVTIKATPTVGNTFITASTVVNVKNTGSRTGYYLVMASENGGALRNGNNSINTFEEGVYKKTGKAMRDANVSSWGYTTDLSTGGELTRTYFPIPVANIAGSGGTSWGETADEGNNRYAYLANTDKFTNRESGDDIQINYGFAIGPDTVAGNYTDTIVYTAIPHPYNPQTILDADYMQDLSDYPEICHNTTTPAPTDTDDTGNIPTKELIDVRDDSKYTVNKLADGNCWMTESLKIGKSTDMTLKPEDSNVTTDFTLHAVKTAASQTANSTTVDYTFTGGANGTYLYNFYAATAGTGTAITSDETNAESDICPKGWHLPNNEGNASWNKLLRVGKDGYQIATSSDGYSSSKVSWGTFNGIKTATANPLGLKLTGGFWDSKLQNNTAAGYYWTRTTNASASAYSLAYNSSNVYPQSDRNKVDGFAVRCVSEGTTE